MTDKFDKLKKLREAGSEKLANQNVDLKNAVSSVKAPEKENTSDVKDVNPTVQSEPPENSSHKVVLSTNDLDQVVKAKLESKLQKISKSKKKEVRPTAQTKVTAELLMDVSWRLKKESVFIQHMNDALYRKLKNDKEFFKTMVQEVKEYESMNESV